MSGDVQPRKRKDKKRKKDEPGDQSPTQPYVSMPTVTPPADDLNIHIHKDAGTGGGICAKIVFFILFSALIVLVGLIITEHRGLTDLDTEDTESKYSQLFKGWIDDSLGQEHEHLDEHHTLDDHDNEHFDDNEPDEISVEEENVSHEQQESNISEHDDSEQASELSEEDNQPSEENDENNDEEQDESDNEDQSESQERQSEEENSNEDINVSKSRESPENDDEQEQNYSEIKQSNGEEGDNEEDFDNEYDVDNEEEVVPEEKTVPTSQQDQQESNEKMQDSTEDNSEGVNDDDNDEDQESTEVVAKESGEDKDESDETVHVKEEIDGEKPDEEAEGNTGTIIKLGIGAAILVVAHVVLVRKWRTVSTTEKIIQHPETPLPDLSRRNTLVAPPPLQEVEQDIEYDEEDYSDDDGDLESDEDVPVGAKSAKTKYQELRQSYSRSLSPESDVEFQVKETIGSDYYDDEEEIEDVEEEELDEEDVEEEQEYENEEYEVDDEELMKKLEAKYGKMEYSGIEKPGSSPTHDSHESDSDKMSDDNNEYEFSSITNKDDWHIKEDLDKGQQQIGNNAAYANKLFDKILEKYPSSPRGLFGKAKALDSLAEQKRSNELLQKAVATYTKILDKKDVPNILFEASAERIINRLTFIGQHGKTISSHLKLMNRFPNNPKYNNQLAVTYLIMGRINDARNVLWSILEKWPNNGCALVHYGFILKTTDNKLEESISYMQKGLDTKEACVIDGRFYFHLGDALSRLGKVEQAMKVYEDGVKHKLFFTKYQRSLYNVPRLTGKPWWDKTQTTYQKFIEHLENNWENIRNEGLAILSKGGYFQDESENLRDTGDWKQFELYARGRKNEKHCNQCPITCGIIESSPDASGCRRGQSKFSVMHPGTHVWAHCGPTNCRLRIHLGLKIPPKTYIRVADETRSWKEGKVIIFDDSFEHEVWHNDTEYRLVLIVDVWHPELNNSEKRSLSAI